MDANQAIPSIVNRKVYCAGKIGGSGLHPLYPQDSGESPLQQLHVQLASPVPYDLEETELAEYKHLVPRWHDWNAVKAACARLSTILFDRLCALEAGPANSNAVEIDGIKRVEFHPIKQAPSP